MLWKILKKLLFSLEAEFAHHLVTRSLLFFRKILGKRLFIEVVGCKEESSASKKVWNLEFLSPLGLAAGFDKNAEYLEFLECMGFGFAEVGTVTPRPQIGNPKPRLFREPSMQVLFNQMGFNNVGAQKAAENLRNAKYKLNPKFKIGVNIGKNKDTPNELAYQDYKSAIEPFLNLADYVVINVSSPNTPGLRSLQSASSLKPIILETLEELSKWDTMPPLLLKLSPEFFKSPVDELMGEIESYGIKGWILTNTLAGAYKNRSMGGYSGSVLTEYSRHILKEARSITQLPIISVGGIMDEKEFMTRIKMGASLVQIYSGWIYGGPKLNQRINENILKEVKLRLDSASP